ncbi:hypothetical protein DIPPA_11607 [Diplonema papillatum]|nr:hypothetical protein DIPPA_11607 [Diplonema papillatum]
MVSYVIEVQEDATQQRFARASSSPSVQLRFEEMVQTSGDPGVVRVGRGPSAQRPVVPIVQPHLVHGGMPMHMPPAEPAASESILVRSAREENARLRKANGSLQAECATLRDENEFLKAYAAGGASALKARGMSPTVKDKMLREQETEIMRLESQVEQLRVALDQSLKRCTEAELRATHVLHTSSDVIERDNQLREMQQVMMQMEHEREMVREKVDSYERETVRWQAEVTEFLAQREAEFQTEMHRIHGDVLTFDRRSRSHAENLQQALRVSEQKASRAEGELHARKVLAESKADASPSRHAGSPATQRGGSPHKLVVLKDGLSREIDVPHKSPTIPSP